MKARAITGLPLGAALLLGPASLPACGSGSASPRDGGSDGASAGDAAEADAGDAGAVACTVVDPWVAEHVAAMATAGWRAVHAQNGLAMHGCAGATTALDCLAPYPLATTSPWGAAWDDAMPAATIRVLRELGHTTSYRSRSSPDGRFVMHGSVGEDGYAVDLARGADIVLEGGLYNPSFAPDGDGFLMQTSEAQMCATSVLVADDPLTIDFQEPSCAELSALAIDVGLGARLGGGGVLAVSSPFTPDRGGADVTNSDPQSEYEQDSELVLTPLVFDGTNFTESTSIEAPVPFEGDAVVSRSATLVLTRHTQDGASAFVLRRLDLDETGGVLAATTTEVGRYCVRGSEPSFSYDDRWVVYHHYVEADDWGELGFASANDPDFLAVRAAGASNLFLLDLVTGQSRRLTAMGPGQYAVYPHFRSDGWIYAIVRDRIRGEELVVATDAALRLE